MALAEPLRGQWSLLLWFALGAWAMRSAGCVYNDIIDRHLDAKVERTRLRPLASGRVSVRAAWILVGALSLIGLVVLLQLNWVARIVALASLAPVAAYPFMKRITWWPQAWLGLVFSWGALVGWTAVRGELGDTALFLYAGSIFWVIGYDTIYALQDREDDALVGVRSSALALGKQARRGIGLCYLAALIIWGGMIWTRRPEFVALLGLLPLGLQFLWQVATLRVDDSADALSKFRSNRFAGLLMFMACLVIGAS
jgi:4-hydroxybenzoate polyprenyltransferase